MTTKSITFAVSNVSKFPLRLNSFSYVAAVEAYLGGKIEAYPVKSQKLMSLQYHGVMQAIESAFNFHLPLVLSPDHIWLMICQGFSHHVNENAETLRKQFVSHEGKLLLTVRRDDFVRGAAENDWPQVFPEFVEQMREQIGKAADLLNPTFSTTSMVERAAAQITLMEAMKNYYDYEVMTKCGIPSVTLEGSVEDWVSIRNRVELFRQYDLDWWIDHLYPVLDQFAQSADGKADQTWWKSFYKLNSGSGGDVISGYATNLLPYVVKRDYTRRLPGGGRSYVYDCAKSLVKNSHLGEPVALGSWGGTLSTSEIPSGIASAPFVWDYLGQRLDYEFLAGFVGISQNDDHAVRPEIGWAVREKTA